MTLEEYLDLNCISVADFTALIGAKSRVTVYRYMKENKNHRIPNPKMMLKIMSVTNGRVSPTDFYSPSGTKRKNRITAAEAIVN